MPKPNYIPPNMVNKYMVDHTDPKAKSLSVIESCATFHATMDELEKDTHHIVLYYEMFLQCPSCRFEGRISIPSTILIKNPEHEINCPNCAQPIPVRQGQALFFAEHRRKNNDQPTTED